MLRVRLIGGIALELDGRELEPPHSRRARGVLAWLALHPGEHARGGVAARFWPDVLDESARASLRAALSELRGALRSGASCLATTRETVGLSGEDGELWIDVRAFAALLAAGRLAEAVEVGSGEMLTGLEGDWVIEAREEHDRELGHALEALAAEADRAGDLAAAVRHTRSAAALDPLSEEVSRRLIDRLARAGERAVALSTYESLAARLRNTLAIAPSPATRALAEGIRREEDPGLAGGVPLPAALGRRHDSPFVGRARELEGLRAAWDGVQLHRARRLVLLAGEPGIGKTRLAQHFAGEAAKRSAVVLIGRCWDEPLGAYDPIVEALRHVEDALGVAALQALAGPTAGELARLLGGAPAVAGSDEDPGIRHRLFDAVDAVLTGLAVDRPLLLMLDDLHWADRPTLLMLTFVLRSRRSAPVMILGTCRDTELGRGSPLVGALAELQRESALDRVGLRGLDSGETALLAGTWLGAEPGGRVAAEIQQRTDGNAFFVEEVLRGFAAHGEGAIPESVRHAVGVRLSSLSDGANRMLAAAAVLGGECHADVLAGVSELSEGAAEEALDEVIHAGLLRPCAGSPRKFEFPHALVREVVYDELNALRRSRLHRRAADQLIARDAERHLEEIAQHLFESAAVEDYQRTVDFLSRAGRRSMTMLAYEAAAGYFERALQIVGAEAGLLIERGDALARAGDHDDARGCFAAAAALARDTAEPQRLAEAALGYAGLGVTIIDIDAEAVALLEEALAAVGEVDAALRSRLLARLAVELYYAPARDRSEALSAEAVTVAQAGADQRALAAALSARHVALWRPDRLMIRLNTADAMIAAAQAAGDGPLELQARNWRVVDLFELGDLDGWRQEVARHTELAAKLRMPAYAWYGPLWEAVDALHQGRFAEAITLRERARELGLRAGDRNADLFSDMLSFVEHLIRGAFHRLDFEMAADKIEHSAAGVSWIPGYAWALAEVDREEEARARLAPLARDRFGALPFDANWLSAIGEASEAIMRIRDPMHAAVLYELLSPYAGRPLTAGRAITSYGAVDRHLAGLAALLGRPDQATRHFEAALQLNAGMRVWLARTQFAFAEHLEVRGKDDRATQLREQGSVSAIELGLPIGGRLQR